MDEIVVVLGSGVALGVYVPPLLLVQQLNKDYHVEFEVIEKYFLDSKLEKICHNKKIFHFNNRIAVKAHQKKIEYEDCYDEEKLKSLFNYWKSNRVYRFIIFSGLWVPIVNSYKNFTIEALKIDCIHMDASISNSWKGQIENMKEMHEIWVYSGKEEKVICKINLEESYPAVPFSKREKRVTVHGGGWGMGTYKTKYVEMVEHNIRMNYILYYKDELDKLCISNNYYLLDESWIPWRKDYIFPPMFKMNIRDKTYKLIASEHRHGFYDILGNSVGIVSKPGGGTLLDSLVTETPIIFLDPVGAYEKSNSDLWIKLGFGYKYEEWKNSKFSYDLLERANEKITKYKEKLEKMEDLLCSLRQM